MLRYILRRLGFLLLTLVVTSLLVFLIAQVVPGDVCKVILGRDISSESGVYLNCRADLGLDQPQIVRYLNWLFDFFRGDWGHSYATNTEIFPWVMGRVRNSLMLAGVTVLFAVPISTALGVIAGFNEGNPLDWLISIVSLSVVGLPEFVTGLLLTCLLLSSTTQTKVCLASSEKVAVIGISTPTRPSLAAISAVTFLSPFALPASPGRILKSSG